MRLNHIIILFTVVLLTNSCGKKQEKGTLNEGIIQYKVTYIENKMSKNIPTNLLPSKITLKFKDEKSALDIGGFMGLFSLKVIIDHKKKTSLSILKVMGNKYYYEGEPNESIFCFNTIPGMKVELRKGDKEIAGVLCKKGQVIFPDSEMEPFAFYYTNDIQLKNPNYGNPYSEVNGTLMKFQVQLNKLRMELSATEIIKDGVTKEDFINQEEGFKRVTRKDMEDILSTLME